MFQGLQKSVILFTKNVNIPSFVISNSHIACNNGVCKTTSNLTIIKTLLKHNQQYVSKSNIMLIPKHGFKSTDSNCQVLTVYNQLVTSWRQVGREKFTKIQSYLTKTTKRGTKFPQRETLGKLVLMSTFLAPTMSFTDTPVEKRSVPINFKRSKRPKLSYILEFLLEIYEAVRLWLRAMRLALTFIPIFTLYPITFIGEGGKDLWWCLLLKAIEFSGPIMIKLGQWVSTRRDLFPDSCCRQFAKLQRSVEPHSWKFTKYQLKRAFGPDWRKVFVKFDNNRNPVGSGCVAQVYKVWMSTDAFPDDEIINEILSEMEDESTDHFEGLHVLGFRSFFGLDDGEEAKQNKVLQEWREHRNEKRRLIKESEEQRKAGIKMDEEAVSMHAITLEKGENDESVNENEGKLFEKTVVETLQDNEELINGGVKNTTKDITKENVQMLDISATEIQDKHLVKVSDKVFEKGNEKFVKILSDNQHEYVFYGEERDDVTTNLQTENGASNESDGNVLSITENLATKLVRNDENQPEDGASEMNADLKAAEETVEHPLVEEWQEEGLNKSLPTEEAPPEDLDGLVPVAVKILHPGINSIFRRDLRIMKICASLLMTLYPPLKWLSLPQCVQEFADVMTPQINLKLEAENMETFTENFADNPYVRFPRPLRPYVTKKVLVETFEEGEQMIDFIGTSGEDKPADLKKRLAEIGVDTLLKMLFLDNLVHGDLHPGNILVQNNSTKEEGKNVASGDIVKFTMVDVGCDTFVMNMEPDPNPLRICLLDCGVASRLKERDLANFKAVFRQVVFGNGGCVADLFLENSEHYCKDPEAFRAEMTSLVNAAREHTLSLAQVDVGVLLQQVLSILSRHQVRLESAFSAVVLAVFVLEGLGRTLDPNMDILERARPVLVTGKK